MPARRQTPDRLHELERALDARPDWLEGALALSDALQESGDPLGEFIALQVQLEQTPGPERKVLKERAAQLLSQHERTWLGVPAATRRALATLEWRSGFVRHLRVNLEPRTRRRELRAPLLTLLRARALRFLQSLELGAIGSNAWPSLLEALSSAPRLSVRSLSVATFFAPDEGLIERVSLGPLAPLGLFAPNVERLTLQGREFGFEGLALPQLRSLDLRLANSRPALLETLHPEGWAQLEHLRLFVSFDDAKKGLDVLARVLTPERCPQLQTLALRYAPSSDALVDLLRQSRLPALRSLDLTGPALSKAALRSLARARESHLPRLERVICLLDGEGPQVDGLEVSRPDDVERDEVPSHPDRRGTRRSRISHSMNVGHSLLREDSHAALASFERARALAEELGDEHLWGRALIGSAEARRLSGRLPEALADCERAAELLADEKADLARALHTYGMVAGDLGRHADARTALERSLALHKQHKNAEGEAYVLQSLALEADAVQDYERSFTLLQRARALASRHALVPLEEHLSRALSLNAQRRGDFDEAMRLLREHAADPDPRVASQNLTNTGTLHWQRGELDLAERCYREALAIAVKHRLPRQEAFAEANLGHLANSRADAPTAIVHLERAVDLFRKTGLSSGEVSALCTLADAFLIANDSANSQRTAEQALQLARSTKNRLCESTANKVLADLALNDWDAGRAMPLARAALSIDEELGGGQKEGQALCWGKVSFAHLILGEFKAARAACEKAVALRAGAGPSRGWSEANRALVEYAAGSFAAAVEACTAALKRGRADDVALGRRVNAYKAAALARTGDVQAAESALSEASAFAKGAPWDPQSTEQLEVCRQVVEVEHRRRAGLATDGLLPRLRRPVSYEGRLFYERLVRPAPVEERRTRKSGR